MSYLTKNYKRKKISFKYGKGSFLYSTNGKKYLDFVQGIAVNSLGHSHPKLVNAVTKQSKKPKTRRYKSNRYSSLIYTSEAAD